MLKNFDEPIIDLAGNPIMDGDRSTPLTMGRAAVNALLNADDAKDGPSKASRYRLASRLYAGGEQDVKAEELSQLKTVVGMAYMPVVVGPFFDWADASYVPAAAGKPPGEVAS